MALFTVCNPTTRAVIHRSVGNSFASLRRRVSTASSVYSILMECSTFLVISICERPSTSLSASPTSEQLRAMPRTLLGGPGAAASRKSLADSRFWGIYKKHAGAMMARQRKGRRSNVGPAEHCRHCRQRPRRTGVGCVRRTAWLLPQVLGSRMSNSQIKPSEEQRSVGAGWPSARQQLHRS